VKEFVKILFPSIDTPAPRERKIVPYCYRLR